MYGLPNNPTLVGGDLTILRHMKVSGKDYPIYYGKMKFMFQTTNQLIQHVFFADGTF